MRKMKIKDAIRHLGDVYQSITDRVAKRGCKYILTDADVRKLDQEADAVEFAIEMLRVLEKVEERLG